MTEPVTLGRKPAKPWKIVVGVVLILMAASNGTKPQPTDAAGALGALTGVLILYGGGAYLIASGLAKNLGTPQFRTARRRLWYKYMGLGFLAMAVVALGLALNGFATGGVLVSWLYWFIWSWVSWKIADKKTADRFGT